MSEEDKDPKGKLTMSVDETAAMLGLARSSAYRGVKNGDIPSWKIGNRYIISRAVITQMLDATSGWAPTDK